MDLRIVLEEVDPDRCYSVYELATGIEIGFVINRHNPPEIPWYAMTPENAARDVWTAPTEGAAKTKEAAAEFLLPRLREPELGAP